MILEPIFHAPDVAEIAARLARVQQKMAEQKLDWYVAFQPDNVFYLTNFANFVHERPFILLIPAQGALKFVVPKLEIPHVVSRGVGDIELIEYFEFPAPDGEGWTDRVGAVLGATGRVGIESVSQVQIYDAIAGDRIRTDIVDEVRMVKSPYEIGRMVYAAQIANAAMADLLANARVGRGLPEVMASAKSLMLGALLKDNPSINPLATRTDAVFQPPHYSDDPHNFSDLAMRMVEGGPHVSVINAVMNGYGTEIERTFFLDHVPETARKPYELMMRARELAFELLKPGIMLGEIDKAVNAMLKAEGFADHLLHRTGHGMGVTAHEAPFLAEGDTHMVEAGMTLTIEPGLYLPGVGGFRHSDTVLVTETGNVALTDGPTSLAELTI